MNLEAFFRLTSVVVHAKTKRSHREPRMGYVQSKSFRAKPNDSMRNPRHENPSAETESTGTRIGG